MTEPCPRCPKFVVRCGHLAEDAKLWLGRMEDGGDEYAVAGPWSTIRPPDLKVGLTRAEADAEFDRREEALLA